jgi:hypothetical protein
MPKTKEPTSLQRARKAHADRMKAAGFKPKTFWISPVAAQALERLKGEPNFALDGKPNEGAAINAALISAAERLAPERPAKPSETAEGRRASSKPPKTAEKPPKASGEAVSQTVGRKKLDLSGVEVHPSLRGHK